jgi:ABC-type oligopeptide transport system ATPase subunit
MNLRKVKNLVKHFKVEGGLLKKPLLSKAVDDVHSIRERETSVRHYFGF